MIIRQSWCVSLLMAGALASCVHEELEMLSSEFNNANGLQISPSVFGLDKAETRATETADVAKQAKNYEESTIHTLDVYLINPDDNKVFLTKRIDEADVQEIKNDGSEKYLITNKCKEDGIDNNKDYVVYVSANSWLTADQVTAMNGKTLAEVKALNTQDANIYKRYATDEAITSWFAQAPHDATRPWQSPFTSDKSFLMDYVTTWNSGSASSKLIEMTTTAGLKRASAKIVFNMEFSDSFRRVLYGQSASATGDPTDEESLSRYIISGEPMFRYVNFAFNTTDFNGGTYDETLGHDVRTGSLIYMTDVTQGDDPNGRYNVYGQTTYSFPFSWNAETKSDDAPHIIVSIPYQQQTREDATAEWTNKGSVQYNYYRIPVCKDDVTELKRNNLYMIKAIINSFGSTTQIDEDQELDLFYEIMDWNEEDPLTMEAKEFNYLKVIPTTVYIYGNGTLSADIQYFINGSSSLAPLSVPAANITYKNASGQSVQVTENDNTTTVTDQGNGTIRIVSKSLANHAVKDFTFTVKLDVGPGEDSKAVEVTVHHIPTDNIQNIAGAWSSKSDGATVTGISANGNATTNANTVAQWEENNYPYLTTIDFRTRYANGYTSTNDYWYRTYYVEGGWGSYEQVTDYSLTEVVGYTKGTGTIYYRKSYQRYTLETTNYDWVDWDKDSQNSQKRLRDYNYGAYNNNFGRFAAKYMDGADRRIANRDTWDNRSKTDVTTNDGASNNHMYVIQIGSTSADYVIGNPTVNMVTHLSQDHVAAPAFMLASQLGTVYPFNNGLRAAAHCSEYVEVTKRSVNGTDRRKIYDDWRLPTKEEINVIIKYQNENISNKVISEVLGGQYYWTLDGTSAYVATGEEGTATYAYTRCIRTMTADDLKFMNEQMTTAELETYMETY